MHERTLNILSLMSQFVQQDKDLFYHEDQLLELLNAHGYTEKEIKESLECLQKITIFDRLEGFENHPFGVSPRVFDPEETFRFTSEARGFLWKLRAAGLINEEIQEEIITKLLTMDVDEIALSDVKLVAALTIFNRMSSIFTGQFSKGLLKEKSERTEPLH
ncbi:MAG: hypothetical protein A3F16_03105 [Deltaproteobacteria bacterium RIFCSPHIGHO2_12_FULL_43_9]|nr:MAG: hypothetical protein A3F16_03105 [Deltaproteobacteria bacterium RIFCSPHIGHO2_12_FULL_43_9]